jgi:endonuclease/exonuclease/phosphatase family metal-dependent hydrolase
MGTGLRLDAHAMTARTATFTAEGTTTTTESQEPAGTTETGQPKDRRSADERRLAANRFTAESGADQRRHAAEISLLNLNAAGGHGNGYRDSDGMDPGDVDELAERIVSSDVDVATLQEVWEQDVDELEEELEERTGNEWDLHFVKASDKYRADDGGFPIRGDANEDFGNVVAVQLGDGVTSSEVVGTQKLDGSGDAWHGSDGRSAISVRLTTEEGSTLDVVTAHTDTAGNIEDPELRAQEISLVREFAEDTADGRPVVIAGDFNATIDDGEATGDALQDYVDAGYTDAGENVGGTADKGHGLRIDYVFASSDLTVSNPTRVQGDSLDHDGEDDDLSDHDGIRVEVSVPD